jgi:hypothetical protein
MRGSSCPRLDQKTPGAEQNSVTALMNRGARHGIIDLCQTRAFFDITSVDGNCDADVLEQDLETTELLNSQAVPVMACAWYGSYLYEKGPIQMAPPVENDAHRRGPCTFRHNLVQGVSKKRG